MFVRAVLAVLGTVSVGVHAQSLSLAGIDSCGLMCNALAVDAHGCTSLLDAACVCANAGFQQTILACANTQCPGTGTIPTILKAQCPNASVVSASSGPQSTEHPTQNTQTTHRKVNVKAIASGAVVGGVLGLLASIAMIRYLRRWQRRTPQPVLLSDDTDEPATPNDMPYPTDKRPLSLATLPADLPSAHHPASPGPYLSHTMNSAAPPEYHLSASLDTVAALREQLDAMRTQLAAGASASTLPAASSAPSVPAASGAATPDTRDLVPPAPPFIQPPFAPPRTFSTPASASAATLPMPMPTVEKEIATLRAQIERLQVHQLRHEVQASAVTSTATANHAHSTNHASTDAADTADRAAAPGGLSADALREVLASLGRLQDEVGELRLQQAQAAAAAAAVERLPSYSLRPREEGGFEG